QHPTLLDFSNIAQTRITWAFLGVCRKVGNVGPPSVSNLALLSLLSLLSTLLLSYNIEIILYRMGIICVGKISNTESNIQHFVSHCSPRGAVDRSLDLPEFRDG